jgi:hypothetical protein
MMIVFALNCRRRLRRESNGVERFAENDLMAGTTSAVHADQTPRLRRQPLIRCALERPPRAGHSTRAKLGNPPTALRLIIYIML